MHIRLTKLRKYCCKVLKIPVISHLIAIDFGTKFPLENAENFQVSRFQTFLGEHASQTTLGAHPPVLSLSCPPLPPLKNLATGLTVLNSRKSEFVMTCKIFDVSGFVIDSLTLIQDYKLCEVSFH